MAERVRTSSSLYEQVGEEKGLPNIIDEFYRRALRDEVLAPFFAEVDREQIRQLEREFFAIAFGDEDAATSSLSVSDAAVSRSVVEHHFDRFVAHLLETLRARHAAETDIDEVAHRLTLYRSDLLGQAG